jgi:methylmalonyl-CoA mutase
MNDPMTDLPLASEFPPASLDAWRKLVDGVLKGAAFERKLVAKTYDGLSIQPLYAHRADARPVVGRTPGAPWQVAQRLEHPDASAANAQARLDLEEGASGLVLVFAGSIGDRGFGLAPSADALRRVLDGIHLDAGILVDLDGSSTALAFDLAQLINERCNKPAETRISFGFDPLGLTAHGTAPDGAWNYASTRLAGTITELAGRGFPGPFLAADGRVIHAAGGSEAQELGFALGCAVAYLRLLEGAGLSLDQARHLISFRLAADADQFLTMAKFRALRKLFARVEAACALAPEPVFISAETAWRMMTRRDPWVNLLRTTMATFAAGLGGADCITVLPFTAALGLPDPFARRLARNTQLILLEESNLAKVSDPAAGSGAMEVLTDELCAAAWAFFQEIEGAGGAHAALTGGLIQRKIAAVRAEREAAVARGRDPITGTSEFPDIRELSVAVLEPAPAPAAPATAPAVEPLPTMRLAEPFERLRDASDAMLSAAGARPKLFLANLGTASDFTTRATFAKNFFEAGGIEAITNDGFNDPVELAAAFKGSGARLACLCSSNENYARDAPAAAAELRKAGATHIYLAGRPGEQEVALKDAGVQTFIYAGCDILATLKAAHDIIPERP